MKETFDKIWQKMKHFGLEVFAFISSKIFIKNFAGVIGMLLVLFFFTTTWLRCYTHHGEALHMANFEGMNLLDVKKIAKKQGFNLVVDSIYIADLPALTVTEQDPKPDALVKEKRTVYLTVTRAGKVLTSIPQLVGNNEDYTLYKKLLIQNGINSQSLSRVDSRIESNTILDIIYEGDTITNDVRDGKYPPIPKGSTLTIVVSKEGYGNTKVPNLICKTLSEAKLILESNNLTVNISYDQTVTDKNNAYVWLQDPAPNSAIRYGEQVKLRVTQYSPEDCEDTINELEAPRDNEPEQDEG